MDKQHGKVTLTFKGDGSGFSELDARMPGKGRPFEWGIEKGRLRVKYLSVYYWQFFLLDYSLDAKGKSLNIYNGHNNYMFPQRLRRVRPASRK